MVDRFGTFATTMTFINSCIRRIKEHEVESLGIKGKHLMCLYVLGNSSGGMTAAQLCTACNEDKAAISRTIAVLKLKKYVYSTIDTEKRSYRAKLRLTQAGKDAMVYINEHIEAVFDKVGGSLSEEQRKVFYDSLAIIANGLKSYIESENIK